MPRRRRCAVEATEDSVNAQTHDEEEGCGTANAVTISEQVSPGFGEDGKQRLGSAVGSARFAY